MNQEADLIHECLRTPRAAAIAGILFSLIKDGPVFMVSSCAPERMVAVA